MTRTAPSSANPMAAPFRKRTYTLPQLSREVVQVARRGPDAGRAWRPERIDPLLREQVMFAVAMVNDCKFCAYVHNGAAIAAGADRDALAELVGLDPATTTDDRLIAVVWGQSRAAAALGPADARLEHELRQHYTPQQVRDLDTIVRVMTVMNVSGNTAEALIRRLRGQAVPGSRVLDEAIIGGGYIIGAAHMAAFLAVRRRVSPLRVLREVLAFDGAAGARAS
ncbi:carboxymuconolactone decarboxylase family protein [Nocardia higoensis]|uniref:Carboxymuconolactone decarboxylase family protein n=1 Tax=Nocardia higoensis TaxID=228599 RepID=A0ABS0DGZ1_9NOCA|nr:carboxymuconolactone decarboxylase family protein [Nocardia higoensis]MBF6357706.1 carboxymuconolactone decarboxylase family protein [Nocardia higoensis]